VIDSQKEVEDHYDVGEVKSGRCVSKNCDENYLFFHAAYAVPLGSYIIYYIYFKIPGNSSNKFCVQK